jgi:hypothetical protein
MGVMQQLKGAPSHKRMPSGLWGGTYLLLMLGFGREPSQDELLCQVGGRSLTGSDEDSLEPEDGKGPGKRGEDCRAR